jgi:hypothetical protein
MFVALKPQKIGDETRWPGELLPEAANWKRRAMINLGHIADYSESQLLQYHRERFENCHDVEHLESYGDLIEPQFAELGDDFAEAITVSYNARLKALEAMDEGDDEALAEARDEFNPPAPTPEDDAEALAPELGEDVTGIASPPLPADEELDAEPPNELACPIDDCDFVGASTRGLATHARKHK